MAAEGIVKTKPTKYKVAALRRAKKYDWKHERIQELARQLNEGYKFMICSK